MLEQAARVSSERGLRSGERPPKGPKEWGLFLSQRPSFREIVRETSGLDALNIHESRSCGLCFLSLFVKTSTLM